MSDDDNPDVIDGSQPHPSYYHTASTYSALGDDSYQQGLSPLADSFLDACGTPPLPSSSSPLQAFTSPFPPSLSLLPLPDTSPLGLFAMGSPLPRSLSPSLQHARLGAHGHRLLAEMPPGQANEGVGRRRDASAEYAQRDMDSIGSSRGEPLPAPMPACSEQPQSSAAPPAGSEECASEDDRHRAIGAWLREEAGQDGRQDLSVDDSVSPPHLVVHARLRRGAKEQVDSAWSCSSNLIPYYQQHWQHKLKLAAKAFPQPSRDDSYDFQLSIQFYLDGHKTVLPFFLTQPFPLKAQQWGGCMSQDFKRTTDLGLKVHDLGITTSSDEDEDEKGPKQRMSGKKQRPVSEDNHASPRSVEEQEKAKAVRKKWWTLRRDFLITITSEPPPRDGRDRTMEKKKEQYQAFFTYFYEKKRRVAAVGVRPHSSSSSSTLSHSASSTSPPPVSSSACSLPSPPPTPATPQPSPVLPRSAKFTVPPAASFLPSLQSLGTKRSAPPTEDVVVEALETEASTALSQLSLDLVTRRVAARVEPPQPLLPSTLKVACRHWQHLYTEADRVITRGELAGVLADPPQLVWLQEQLQAKAISAASSLPSVGSHLDGMDQTRFLQLLLLLFPTTYYLCRLVTEEELRSSAERRFPLELYPLVLRVMFNPMYPEVALADVVTALWGHLVMLAGDRPEMRYVGVQGRDHARRWLTSSGSPPQCLLRLAENRQGVVFDRGANTYHASGLNFVISYTGSGSQLGHQILVLRKVNGEWWIADAEAVHWSLRCAVEEVIHNGRVAMEGGALTMARPHHHYSFRSHTATIARAPRPLACRASFSLRLSVSCACGCSDVVEHPCLQYQRSDVEHTESS